MPKRFTIRTDMDALNMRSQLSLFENIASSKEDVLIDIEGVSFIDSSGIGGLVFLFKRLREHGHTLKLVGAHGQPMQLLRHLGLEALLLAPLENASGPTAVVS